MIGLPAGIVRAGLASLPSDADQDIKEYNNTKITLFKIYYINIVFSIRSITLRYSMVENLILQTVYLLNFGIMFWSKMILTKF